jgi:feruloyl esterase
MKLTVIAFVLLIPLIVGVGSAFSVPTQADCEALKEIVEGMTDEAFGMPVTNVTATWRTSTSGPTSGAKFCQVTGWIWPEIKFQVTLPTLTPAEEPAWNERYLMNGGGGWDGNLSVPNSPNADGYVQSSANGGYMSRNWPSGSGVFGLKEPYFSDYYGSADYPTGLGGFYGSVDPKGTGNPYACQKVVDFGIRHLYETPVIAKKIIRQYYGADPKYSYYSGSSCGGKEGQITAQNFYDLFDGFYINCPLGGHVAVTFRGTWDTLWGADLVKQADPSCVPVFCPPGSPPGCVPVTCPSVYSYKQALHYKNVYDKCDEVDGLRDGLIDDPRKCNFDALTDLTACTEEEEAAEAAGNIQSTCFTLAQRKALKEIYVGPHNSRGKAWYVGQPVGAEYLAAGFFGGGVSSGFGSALSDGMAPGMFAFIALDPPDGPNFDITAFDWNKDPKAMEKTTCKQCYDDGTCETFNIQNTLDAITISPSPAPNMGGFWPLYKKGGKIIQMHGWADSLVSALGGSSQFYETVLKQMGVDRTKSFWKLYMVPGAGHCGGGIGIYPTTGFQALVDWVEKDVEPHALIGSRGANVDKNPWYPYWTEARTRPICPYPEVARWNGSYSDGGIEDADNFSCVPPIEVRIEPEVLNLNRKGVFTAFITIPRDYRMKDWNLHGVTCEGVPAKFGFAHGNVYVAKFDTEDFQDVLTPGESVTLTVNGVFHNDGKDALVQASDTVRVIEPHWWHGWHKGWDHDGCDR